MKERIKKAKPRIRWWVKGLVVVASLSVLALAAVYLLGVRSNWRWEAYAEELRATGEPLTFDEIEAQRLPQGDEPTVASLLLDLSAQLETLDSPIRQHL